MSPDMSPQNAEQEARKAIARPHLIKAMLKAIPLVGDVVNEMTVEVAKSEADAQSKKRLMDALDALHTQMRVQDTDLGNILARLDEQKTLTQGVHDALQAIIAYANDKADAPTATRVQAAIEKTLPGTAALTVATAEANGHQIERYAFSKALYEQFEPEQIALIVSDTPGARKKVPIRDGQEQQIDALLNWTKTADGPGYNGLLEIVLRRYPRFKLPPP